MPDALAELHAEEGIHGSDMAQHLPPRRVVGALALRLDASHADHRAPITSPVPLVAALFQLMFPFPQFGGLVLAQGTGYGRDLA